VQHYFAALDEKSFLLRLTSGHRYACSHSARVLNVLQLFILDLCEPLQIICLFYSLCIALQMHTTSQSEYRLL